MAPNRKRVAQRVAAAVAARRKWKAGDLVLAKVKGFPAWPATVGEPEKWGHSADSKKVVVCFFGCEQIAFCNPAELEEFTEEKKLSLLGKRHGKGADFCRAANEIIECFEKMKTQSDFGTDREKIIINGDSNRSPIKPVKNEAPIASVEPLPTQITDDCNFPTEGAMVADEKPLHDGETQVLETSSSFELTEAPVSAPVYRRSKKKFSWAIGSPESNKPAIRSRSTSFADTGKLGNRKSRRTRHSGASFSQNCLLRRSRRIMKLSDDSEGPAADSHDSLSDDSFEDSHSEIMSVESDSVSINDATTFDFDSKLLAAKILCETNTGERALSKFTIIKKKRMPSRKRHHNDNVCSDAEVVKSFDLSPSCSQSLSQRLVKEDGDEHLPLVKRARMRMGRTSLSVMDEVAVVHQTPIVCNNPESPTLQCNNDKVDNFADVEHRSYKEDQANSPLPQLSPTKKSHFWNFKKKSTDGEATLPPSKRILRALEAMSANAVEDFKRTSHDSLAVSDSTTCYSGAQECQELVPNKNGKKWVSEAEDDMHGSGICIVSDSRALVNHAEAILETQNHYDIDNRIANDESLEDSNGPAVSPVNDLTKETVVELHEELDSATAIDKLVPCPKFPASDLCVSRLLILNNEERISDPGILGINKISSVVKENDGATVDINTASHLDDANDLMENKKETRRTELDEEANLQSLDSNGIVSGELSGNTHSQLLISSISCEYMDDKIGSVPQSFSSVANGPESSASVKCNMLATDDFCFDNNTSPSPNSHLHPEILKPENKSCVGEESLLAFESMVGSLIETEDTFGRATQMALDAAESGLATQVLEILACNLERETVLAKKIILFFLVDSIIQASKTTKGDGAIYPSSVQAVLPRLLSAAAPQSSISHENHWQCLKVLKVWLEKRILPEPIIHHHIRELEAVCSPHSAVGSWRPQINERAFDDPVGQKESILVDKFESHSSTQIPGSHMSAAIRSGSDVINDSDGDNPESVGHNIETQNILLNSSCTVEKHSCILEDVEGELEMEDVAPCEGDAFLAHDAGADPCSNNNEILQQGDMHPPSIQSPLFGSHPLPPHLNSPSVFPAVAPADVLAPKHFPSSQNYNIEFRESVCNQSGLPRVKSRAVAAHRLQENDYFEGQMPRKVPDSINRPSSHFSGRASSDFQTGDAFSRGFHLRPPHPASQFPYVYDREQSRRDVPPPYYNGYRSRHHENHGNFHRFRDRNKFIHREKVGGYCRPPYPYSSGPCYQDSGRMAHAPPSYGGLPREPAFPNNRWNYPPGPGSHRHANHYSHLEGPIPVESRAHNYWGHR